MDRIDHIGKFAVGGLQRHFEQVPQDHGVIRVETVGVIRIANADPDLIDARLHAFCDIHVDVGQGRVGEPAEGAVDEDGGIQVILREMENKRTPDRFLGHLHPRAIPNAMG